MSPSTLAGSGLVTRSPMVWLALALAFGVASSASALARAGGEPAVEPGSELPAAPSEPPAVPEPGEPGEPETPVGGVESPETGGTAEAEVATEAPSSPAEPAWDPGFQLALELGGASVIRYSAPDETGNAFGGVVVARVGALTFGLGLAAVMPDSRTQANFLTLWAEARFDLAALPLGSGVALSPYVLVGIGGALSDGFLPPRTGFIPPRWSRDGSLLAVGGLGARLGAPHGMYLSAEARAYNHTHLGLQLMVGHTFW